MFLVTIGCASDCSLCHIVFIFLIVQLRSESSAFSRSLMLNCYYCLNGTKSAYFGHATPSLEEYLPIDEQLLPPPAIQLGDTWDFWGVPHPHNI
jgi:hypothetical protein